MNHRIVAAIATATLASAAGAIAQTSRWEIDPVHSNIAFSVRHMMISNVRGVFTKFTGVLEGNPADVSTAKVNVTIDAASIDTREPARDKDLMGPNYLDVVKYPTLTFVSKKVETAGEGHLKVTGDLTIHGVTRPVVLDVEGVTPPTKDPWGGTRVGAHATTTINRKDFGLVWNKTLETGGVLVGEDVAITLDVELVKKS